MAGSFLTADLTAVFNTTDFGIPVVVGGNTVTGILDDGDEVVQSDEHAGFVASVTRLVLSTSDAGSVENGSNITINGTTYTVRERMDEYDGVTTLHLEDVS